jgi:hypothetical protein
VILRSPEILIVSGTCSGLHRRARDDFAEEGSEQS